MELIMTMDEVIVHDKDMHRSLWCNRIDGTLLPAPGDRLMEAWNPVCKGLIYGIVGKMQILPSCGWKLLVITDREFVGYLPKGVMVYSITKIAVIPLSSEKCADVVDDVLLPCPSHSQHPNVNNAVSATHKRVQQTWSSLKTGASNFTNKRNVILKDLKDKDKLEQRLVEELIKMFTDSRSFYYSPNGDLTNSTQRMDGSSSEYSWEKADDRFFWNKFMLTDLIESEDPAAGAWIMPIIYGFVQIQRCFIKQSEVFDYGYNDVDSESDDEDAGQNLTVNYHTSENLKKDEFDLIVISRRSRYRAGTRYKRRGINEDGYVANYVETEQIVCVLTHIISCVQIRGSVPFYWSQPGMKYRPLPIINRSFEESQNAFKMHFDHELDLYKEQVVVSLVELTGREKIIADSFMEHILEYNSDKLTFVLFDFHEHCRGMKFENVSVLTYAMKDFFEQMGFYWADDSGCISKQKSTFRVNCMDCLDRTNVVEASFAREMLVIIRAVHVMFKRAATTISTVLDELRKMGRLLPETPLPSSCRRIHNNIWANNGDVISIQYAGTAAMKGDFTRTGERKFAGIMKDGYNSANRYYLNRFKDNYRQAVIDMMLGNPITEDISAIINESSIFPEDTEDELWTSEKEECITQLVRHSQLSLLPRNEESLGGWALVDPLTFSSNNPQDEDVILMLTHDAYYVARYSDELEELSSYQRIPVDSLTKIEIGYESYHFKNKHIFMRMHFTLRSTSGYHHTLRTIQRRSTEESKGILLSIAELFLSVKRYQGSPLKVCEAKLDRKNTKPHTNIVPVSSKRTLSTSSRTKLEAMAQFKKNNDKKLNVPQIHFNEDIAMKRVNSDNNFNEDIAIKRVNSDNNLLRYNLKSSPNKNKSIHLEVNRSHTVTPTETTKLGMTKSTSEGDIFNVSQLPERPSSCIDILRKTKTVLGNVGTRLKEVPATSNDDATVRERFQKLNRPEMKNPLKMLPQFRNRIQTVFASPRTQRKTQPPSADEIERRRNCKTKIIELKN